MAFHIADRCVALAAHTLSSTHLVLRRAERTLGCNQHRSTYYRRDNRHRCSIQDRISCYLPIAGTRLVY